MNPRVQLVILDSDIYVAHLAMEFLERELRDVRNNLKHLEAQRAQLLAEVHA
jgi:hypothetical protein